MSRRIHTPEQTIDNRLLLPLLSIVSNSIRDNKSLYCVISGMEKLSTFCIPLLLFLFSEYKPQQFDRPLEMEPPFTSHEFPPTGAPVHV